ncbi:MAG: hypothetical protein A3K19_11600 [Lentisphaerae bacterium RIFOXYB12_FULL_65_16]|nr:MAG: hypothetical protein A3K19_11600 [Lentisphaerae bacterium RIFOXYB12_FULL_65_16]
MVLSVCLRRVSIDGDTQVQISTSHDLLCDAWVVQQAAVGHEQACETHGVGHSEDYGEVWM